MRRIRYRKKTCCFGATEMEVLRDMWGRVMTEALMTDVAVRMKVLKLSDRKLINGNRKVLES